MSGDYPDSDRPGAGAKGQPGAPAQQSLKGDPTLQSRVAAQDYELSEKKHENHFRRVMLLGLPTLTGAWLVSIAWTILTGRITGIQVGIALGVTGAGLLTLLGLQIEWAYSQKDERGHGHSGRVFKSVISHFVE